MTLGVCAASSNPCFTRTARSGQAMSQFVFQFFAGASSPPYSGEPGYPGLPGMEGQGTPITFLYPAQLAPPPRPRPLQTRVGQPMSLTPVSPTPRQPEQDLAAPARSRSRRVERDRRRSRDHSRARQRKSQSHRTRSPSHRRRTLHRRSETATQSPPGDFRGGGIYRPNPAIGSKFPFPTCSAPPPGEFRRQRPDHLREVPRRRCSKLLRRKCLAQTPQPTHVSAPATSTKSCGPPRPVASVVLDIHKQLIEQLGTTDMAPRPWTPGKSAPAIPSGSTGAERPISSGTAHQRLEALIQAQAHSRDQAPEVVEFEQACHMPLQELTRLISSIDAAAILRSRWMP